MIEERDGAIVRMGATPDDVVLLDLVVRERWIEQGSHLGGVMTLEHMVMDPDKVLDVLKNDQICAKLKTFIQRGVTIIVALVTRTTG